MGNSNSHPNDKEVDPSNVIDDFEPIDKPASPTFMSTFQKSNNNPNDDLATSGVLVDMPDEDKTSTVQGSSNHRRTAEKKERQQHQNQHQHHNHHHDVVPLTQQTDAELLQESLTKDKQERLQKLQSDQKIRRNKAVEERRKSPPPPSDVQPNPFSRFLSVFSVEPQFPNHKRRYEPSDWEAGDVPEDEPKRPKLDPNSSQDEPKKSIMLDWLDTYLPTGWPWMAAATTAAVVAFLLAARNKQPPKVTDSIW